MASLPSEAQVIFRSTHCKNLVDIQQVKPRKPWWVLNDWVPLEFLALAVHTEPPAFINYSPGFPTAAQVPTEVSGPVSCDSLYSPVGLSNFGGTGLPCDIMDLRLVDFSVCWVFHFLGHNDNFQASYMLDQKPEVLDQTS